MKVYLRQDIERVGLAGEIITVPDGFAYNYLLPKKFAVEVTRANESFYASRERTVEKRKEVLNSTTSMLAQKIADTKLIITVKAHDDGKLYGSVGPAEISQTFAQKGIAVSKNQVHIKKSIKECGDHTVTIKLSSRLQPVCTVTIVCE